MFEFVRRHTKLLQIILFLLIFPSFVVFGIQGYSRFTSSEDVAARVDGITISNEQFDAAQREAVSRLQAQMGSGVDVATIDTPALRMRTLDGLIDQLVLQLAARKQRLSVTDQQVSAAILKIPEIAALPRLSDGSFDLKAYDALLSANGLDRKQFEQQQRERLLLRQVLAGVSDPIVESHAVAQRLADWRAQTRTLRVATFDPAAYAAQVQPTEAQIAAYYQQHRQTFAQPAQADIEYVVFGADAERARFAPTDAAMRAYYAAHQAEFGKPEQRSARHILIAVPSGASAAQDAAARARADAIAAEVRRDPSRFAALARSDSQDPGSAANGGDLGSFTREGMVKPFSDAVFAAAKVGDIIGPVRTQYGYHVIELTGITPAQAQPYAAVQDQIRAKLADQQVRKAWPGDSESFGNQVYEDSRSYAKVAATYGLKVLQATAVTATPRQGDPKTDPLANPAFLQALFSARSVGDKRNIAPVEIGPDTLASGRIVSYTPAATLTLAQAHDKARAMLVAEGAAALATKAGEQALAALQHGGAQPTWGPTVQLSLSTPPKDQTLPPAAVQAAFSLPTDHLPASTGVALPGKGYAIVQVDAVDGKPADATEVAQIEDVLSRQLGGAVADADMQALRQQFGVKILRAPGAQPTN